MDPSGKVCVVTGGAQGLGKEVTKQLLQRGAKVRRGVETYLVVDKYSLFMSCIKIESFAKFILDKKSVYAWVNLFAIYVLYLSTEEAL